MGLTDLVVKAALVTGIAGAGAAGGYALNGQETVDCKAQYSAALQETQKQFAEVRGQGTAPSTDVKCAYVFSQEPAENTAVCKYEPTGETFAIGKTSLFGKESVTCGRYDVSKFDAAKTTAVEMQPEVAKYSVKQK